MNPEWEIRSTLQTNDPIKEILKARGVTDVEAFLNPSIKDLYNPAFDPYNLKDMAAAVARIKEARDNDEEVLVAGDYDADGVTSTSLLVIGLEELDMRVSYRVPTRQEGYGLSKATIKEAFDKGIRLIITCDNGISLVDEVAYANKLGVDIIITDHHEPQETLPDALAVIDPKRNDCQYPTKDLCGCGVAFKVLQALNDLIFGDMKYTENYLDIVAIGTIADMMKLTGENRLIVIYGLRKLVDSDNKGLNEILHVLNLADKEEITTRNVGMNIGPTFNAIGRIGDPKYAVDMLVTTNRKRAQKLAEYLHQMNLDRRKLTTEWSAKIIEEIEASPKLHQMKVMVTLHYGIPAGLVGLIAGKLKERYAKPVILLTCPDEHSKRVHGSGRSVMGYDMFESVGAHKHLLSSFGGHPGACGVGLLKENLKEFTTLVNDNCVIELSDLQPKLYIDYEVEPDLITKSFAQDLSAMAPYGQGNERPLFLLRDVLVTDVKGIGKDEKTMKFMAHMRDIQIEAIGFSMMEKYQAMGAPQKVDIAFYPGLNTWAGRTKVQLEIQDIREAM